MLNRNTYGINYFRIMILYYLEIYNSYKLSTNDIYGSHYNVIISGIKIMNLLQTRTLRILASKNTLYQKYAILLRFKANRKIQYNLHIRWRRVKDRHTHYVAYSA